MKFAIYAQTYKPQNRDIIEQLIHVIKQNSGTLIFEKDYYDILLKEGVIDEQYNTFTNHNDLEENINFFVSIGGDGTMLRAANFVKSKNIPIIGINAGRLGYLANVQQQEIEALIPSLFSNAYTLSRRTLLELKTHRRKLLHLISILH